MQCKNKELLDPICIMIDIDSFEVQVWIEKNPELAGKPVVIHDSSNRIRAVSYEAKSYGVARKNEINEAKEKCPQLYCFQVPELLGKPDLTILIQASQRLEMCVRQFFSESGYKASFKMASIDDMYCEVHKEVYSRLDKTKSNSALVYPMDKTILINGEKSTDRDFIYQIGGMMAGEILQHIKSITGFQGSAGVGRSMLLSKLACGLSRPAGVTIVTPNGLNELYEKTRLQEAPGLGGKRGTEIVEKLKMLDGKSVVTLKDLTSIENSEFTRLYGTKFGREMEKLAKGESDSILHAKAKEWSYFNI